MDTRDNDIRCFKNRKQIYLKQDEILYLQAYNGYILYHTKDGCYRNDISLCMALKNYMSDKLFIRINRQHAINIKYIESYVDGWVSIGKNNFPVSRRERVKFEKKYITDVIEGR